MQRFLIMVDQISTWVGHIFAWCIVLLTFAVSYEVFSRYVLSRPTTWAYDTAYILYGTLFMMAGAYAAVAQRPCPRRLPVSHLAARVQAGLDWCCTSSSSSGNTALIYSGYGFAKLSG